MNISDKIYLINFDILNPIKINPGLSSKFLDLTVHESVVF